MSENKRIRIVSNGRCGIPGDTHVFIDDQDVTNSVTKVTWTIGVDQDLSSATLTFVASELEVDYVAVEHIPVQVMRAGEDATVVPAAYFKELVADLDAPDEPNERVREAARRLPEIVSRAEEADA